MPSDYEITQIKGIKYGLVRSRRKTIALYITREGALNVRAPLKMSKTDIDRFVASKESWIKKHLAKIEQRASTSDKPIDYGDKLLFRGQECIVTANKSGKGSRFNSDGSELLIPPGLNTDKIKQAIVKAYVAAARDDLTDRVWRFSDLMGVRPQAIRITNAKTRWGSCSSKNTINFTWRLLFAPVEIIDYVVVHELAHIKEHNHSDRFWKIVCDIMPDYKTRRNELRVLERNNRWIFERFDV